MGRRLPPYSTTCCRTPMRYAVASPARWALVDENDRSSIVVYRRPDQAALPWMSDWSYWPNVETTGNRATHARVAGSGTTLRIVVEIPGSSTHRGRRNSRCNRWGDPELAEDTADRPDYRSPDHGHERHPWDALGEEDARTRPDDARRRHAKRGPGTHARMPEVDRVIIALLGRPYRRFFFSPFSLALSSSLRSQ